MGINFLGCNFIVILFDFIYYLFVQVIIGNDYGIFEVVFIQNMLGIFVQFGEVVIIELDFQEVMVVGL